MKNVFATTCAVLLVMYPAALAAAILGLLPTTVMSFSTFVAFFVAAGVLAIVVHDYTRRPAAYATRRRPTPAASFVRPPAPIPPPGAAWLYRTAS